MREMINYRDYLIGRLADREEAIVYLEVSIEEYQKDGDTVAFLIALQSIAKAQAENNEIASQVYLLSGGVHLSSGEYDWAIEDYDTVIKLNPDSVDAYIHRGLAYHHKGEYDRAIGDFTKAIELKPNCAGAYYDRGVA